MKGKTETCKIRLLAVFWFVLGHETFSRRDIEQMLEKRYGIAVDRKTIADDLITIDRFVPITMTGRGRNAKYQRFR